MLNARQRVPANSTAMFGADEGVLQLITRELFALYKLAWHHLYLLVVSGGVAFSMTSRLLAHCLSA